MTPVRYPSLQAVIEYNRRHGGAGAGVRDPEVIAGAVARPSHSFAGVDAHPTLWDKAAALLHGLASTQGFQDGNKRTAWVTCEAFLRANGYPLGAIPTVGAEVFVLATSVSLIEMPTIAEWLREHAAAAPSIPHRGPAGHASLTEAELRRATAVMFQRRPDSIDVHAMRPALSTANAQTENDEDQELEELASFNMALEQFRTTFGHFLGELGKSEPSRNAPCPCGSGRKYKHCHGAPAGA